MLLWKITVEPSVATADAHCYSVGYQKCKILTKIYGTRMTQIRRIKKDFLIVLF